VQPVAAGAAASAAGTAEIGEYRSRATAVRMAEVARRDVELVTVLQVQRPVPTEEPGVTRHAADPGAVVVARIRMCARRQDREACERSGPDRPSYGGSNHSPISPSPWADPHGYGRIPVGARPCQGQNADGVDLPRRLRSVCLAKLL